MFVQIILFLYCARLSGGVPIILIDDNTPNDYNNMCVTLEICGIKVRQLKV